MTERLPEIVLCLPPRSLHPNANRPMRNSRGVMMGRSRERKKYRQHAAECGVAWIVELFEHRSRAPRFHEAHVQLTFDLAGKRRMDADNLLAWAKAGIDGLVDAGVFEDDDRLTWLPVRQEVNSLFPALRVQIVVAEANATFPTAAGDLRTLLTDVQRLLECYDARALVPPAQLDATRRDVLARVRSSLQAGEIDAA